MSYSVAVFVDDVRVLRWIVNSGSDHVTQSVTVDLLQNWRRQLRHWILSTLRHLQR